MAWPPPPSALRPACCPPPSRRSCAPARCHSRPFAAWRRPRSGRPRHGWRGTSPPRRAAAAGPSSAACPDPRASGRAALEIRSTAAHLEKLDAQIGERQAEVDAEAAELAARKAELKAAATEAADKRLERLNDALASSEAEIAGAVASQRAVAEQVAAARAPMRKLAKHAPPTAIGAATSPEDCDDDELPDAMQYLVDALLLNEYRDEPGKGSKSSTRQALA